MDKQRNAAVRGARAATIATAMAAAFAAPMVAAVAAAATVANNITAENVRTTPPSREVDSALAVFFSDLHVNGREDIGYVH